MIVNHKSILKKYTMMAFNFIRQSSCRFAVRRINVHLGIAPISSTARCMATVPRSAVTPDSDKNEDNILPVSFYAVLLFLNTFIRFNIVTILFIFQYIR